jgi:hypothetical protein
VRVPQEAADGKARLTISFTDYRGLASPTKKDGLKEWNVAPAVVEIAGIGKAASKAP